MISNKNLYKIHSWLGLNLGLFLFVICFSGTIAVFSSDIDWLSNPDMRIEPMDEPIEWGKMHESIQQEFPGGTNLGLYKETYTGTGGSFATVAYVTTLNGQTRKVYLNPYTGNIQGHTSFFNVQRFFRTFHRRFFDGNRGIILVTLTSFFLLFSIITGLLFYKGWLKNLFTLRIKDGLKRFFSDAHKLAGIWTLLFGLLIAVTGVFYFTELMINASDNSEVLLPEGPPELTSESIFSSTNSSVKLADIDSVVRNAKDAFPELEIMSLRVPIEPADYFYVDGQAGNPLTRNRANKVYLHPITGEVAHIQYSSELNTAELITDIADPLHFGTFGGMITKIIWFIFGLTLCFSILSGTYIWQIRASQKVQKILKRAERKNSTPPGFWHKLNQQKSILISVAIVLLYFTYIFIATLSGIKGFSPQHQVVSTSTVTHTPGSTEFDIKLTERWIQTQSTEFGEIEIQLLSDALLPIKSVEWVEGIENASSKNLTTAERRGHPQQQLFVISGLERNARGTINIYFFDQSSITIENVVPEFCSPIQTQELSSSMGQFPKAPTGVWISIILFSVLTMGIIIYWAYLILKPVLTLK